MISIEPLLISDFSKRHVMAKIAWLREEIQRRYLGKFQSLNPAFKSVSTIKDNEVFLYDSAHDMLFIKGSSLGGLIYKDRQWADIA